MPQIRITEIPGPGNISDGRLTINNNFIIIQDAINNLQNYLDIDNKELKGLQSLTAFKGNEAVATPNDVLIRTNGSISALGSITIGGSVNGNTGKFAAGLEVTQGDFNLPSSNTNLNLAGNLALAGEFVLTDFALDGIITAYDKNYYQLASTSGENLLITDDFGVAIGGKLSMKGRSSIILDWRAYEATNLDYALNRVMLMTNSQATNSCKIGQIVEVIALIAAESPYYFYLLGDTLRHPGGEFASDPSGIRFDKSYQSVRLIYDGNNWIVLNVEGATIVY